MQYYANTYTIYMRINIFTTYRKTIPQSKLSYEGIMIYTEQNTKKSNLKNALF